VSDSIRLFYVFRSIRNVLAARGLLTWREVRSTSAVILRVGVPEGACLMKIAFSINVFMYNLLFQNSSKKRCLRISD